MQLMGVVDVQLGAALPSITMMQLDAAAQLYAAILHLCLACCGHNLEFSPAQACRAALWLIHSLPAQQLSRTRI